MTVPAPSPVHYCWFDTEYTTLDLDQARLLQVAVVVTDHQLRPLLPRELDPAWDGHMRINGLVLHLRPAEDWEPGGFISDNMPQLVEHCRAHGLDRETVDGMCARYMDAVVGPPAKLVQQRPMLAGNSVHCDWFLARRDLPAFTARLHYRQLDASSFKAEWLAGLGGESPRLLDKEDPAAVLEAFPAADLEGGAPHDAYYDAQCSIAEMAWYRARLRRIECEG